MANDAVTVLNAGVGGDSMDETGQLVNGTLVKRPRVVIGGDANHAALVDPITTTPVGNEYALPTRNITAKATSGAPVGVVVSTTAVLVQASNTARKSIVISNNGTSNVFVGHDSTVTSTGATMGVKLLPGGVYSDSGEGLYTGDLYAIADATTATANTSSWERS